jgi:hypothetical protein
MVRFLFRMDSRLRGNDRDVSRKNSTRNCCHCEEGFSPTWQSNACLRWSVCSQRRRLLRRRGLLEMTETTRRKKEQALGLLFSSFF